MLLCQERILRMEEQVGVIADNPNYALVEQMATTGAFSKVNKEEL